MLLSNSTFTMKVMAITLTRSILKQLRVKYDMSRMQAEDTKFVAWFYGERVLGKEYGNKPYVLCTRFDSPFLYCPVTYKIDEGNLLTTLGISVPFAVVPK